MSSTPLIVLGSMLVLVTILIFIVFMIAGGFRRSLVDIRVLIVSGTTGLVMLGLGVASMIYGSFLLHFAFMILTPLIFLGLAILCVRMFQGVKVREYIRREHAKPVLRFLLRIGMVSGAILLVDVIGLWVFLFSQGLWKLPSFLELLTLLLLLEGTLIGAAGAFMFYGYSEYGLMRQAALWPTLAGDQARRWKDRRVSQQKWGIAMLIAGFLLIVLGLLVSFFGSV